MSKPDLGRIIAQTMAKPVEGRTIETITDEILDAKRTGGEAILTIGRCLIEAKDMLPHGEWLPWLNERVELSARAAQRFMRLAREWSNPTTLSDLGASKALALLALPLEEREQFVEDHNVIDMSARQLKEAIRERDEARKAAETAKADASAAEQARAKMAEDMLINTSKGNTISKIPPTPMHTSSGTEKMMTTAPTPTRLTGTATRGLLAKSMQAGKARVMETSWQRKRMLSPIPEPSTASLCPLM